jgi:hypothetical protein
MSTEEGYYLLTKQTERDREFQAVLPNEHTTTIHNIFIIILSHILSFSIMLISFL